MLWLASHDPTRTTLQGLSSRGTAHSSLDPLRVVENLVDGTFDLNTIDTCYITSSYETYHWFLLDFGVPLTLHLVKLCGQPRGALHILETLAYLEVRPVSQVGNLYALLGTFPGPATSFNQKIVIKAPVPRFLSVQRVRGTKLFQLSHVEVY